MQPFHKSVKIESCNAFLAANMLLRRRRVGSRASIFGLFFEFLRQQVENWWIERQGQEEGALKHLR